MGEALVLRRGKPFDIWELNEFKQWSDSSGSADIDVTLPDEIAVNDVKIVIVSRGGSASSSIAIYEFKAGVGTKVCGSSLFADTTTINANKELRIPYSGGGSSAHGYTVFY